MISIENVNRSTMTNVLPTFLPFSTMDTKKQLVNTINIKSLTKTQTLIIKYSLTLVLTVTSRPKKEK